MTQAVTRPEHWNGVFASKREDEVSWFEREPAVSLRLLDVAGLTTDTCIVDVGGGESYLVDALIERGLRCISVLDVSRVALERTRARLGALAGIPTWIEADVTGRWSIDPVDVWHDRAVFHFLTDGQDRNAYRQHLIDTVKQGGAAVVATFALDGPEKCSGLPVVRYSPATLAQELGPNLELIESLPHIHATPWGTTQSFQYSLFRRL